MLDSAAKVFSIPVQCFAPGDSGFNKLVHYSKLGYAFAGSALVGMNTYALLTTCLSQLNVVDTTLPQWVLDMHNLSAQGLPNLHAIAQLAGRFLERFSSQLALTLGGGALCEIVLTGQCTVTGELQMFHIRTMAGSDGLTHEIVQYRERSCPDDFVLLLGNSRARIGEGIKGLRGRLERDCKNRQGLSLWWRAPLSNLCRELDAPGSPTIGGYPQLGIGSEGNFRLLSIASQNDGELENSYLGFSLTNEHRHIGPGCFLGTHGMLIDDLIEFVRNVPVADISNVLQHVSWNQERKPWQFEVYESNDKYGYRIYDDEGNLLVHQPPSRNSQALGMSKIEAEAEAKLALDLLPKPRPYTRRTLGWSFETFDGEYGVGYRLKNKKRSGSTIEQSYAPGLPGFASMTLHGARVFAYCLVQQGGFPGCL